MTTEEKAISVQGTEEAPRTVLITGTVRCANYGKPVEAADVYCYEVMEDGSWRLFGKPVASAGDGTFALAVPADVRAVIDVNPPAPHCTRALPPKAYKEDEDLGAFGVMHMRDVERERFEGHAMAAEPSEETLSGRSYDDYTYYGKVTCMESGAPLYGASVEVQEFPGYPCDTTDQSGCFCIFDLDGSYTAIITCALHTPRTDNYVEIPNPDSNSSNAPYNYALYPNASNHADAHGSGTDSCS